jgi:hypothetical protein
VDSVPAGNTVPTLITVQNGDYNEIVNVNGKHNLTFRGQSRDGVVIGYANNANIAPSGAVAYRMAVKINANDIAFDNLTLTNRTPNGGSQAEALSLRESALRFTFNNCTVASYQDTIFTGGSLASGQSQAYFKNSLIIGDGDYIWGYGVGFFTNCEVRTTGPDTSGNVVATRTVNGASGNWAGYNGLYSSNGYSFVNCTFTKASGMSTITLAGSNGNTNGVAAWINCTMASGYAAPQSGALNSELLWGYGNTLAGSPNSFGLTALTSNDPRLLAAQSAVNWLYGWQPANAPDIMLASGSNPSPAGNDITLTATVQTNGSTVGNAGGWMVFKDGAIPLGTNAVVNGVATFNTGPLALGAHTITASYSGDAAYLSGTSAVLTQQVVNLPPVALAVTNTVNQYASLTVTNNPDKLPFVSDADGHTVTNITVVVPPPGGTATPVVGGITYTNTAGVAGVWDTLTYAVNDGFGGSATNTMSFWIMSAEGFNLYSQSNHLGYAYLTYLGIPGQSYVSERSTNLASGVWVPVGTNAAQAVSDPYPGRVSFTNEILSPESYFRTRGQ